MDFAAKPLAVELLILCFLALLVTAWSQSTRGFISIDCGYEEASNYTEQNTKIVYSPDDPYIESGKNGKVHPEANITGLFGFYQTLRSFPLGNRNCYTLRPVQRGGKYLIRAEFMYGNFDGQNSPPSFNVYLGIHLWGTVYSNFSRLEIIAVSPGDYLEVCLVNTGFGTPYVTVLELRPLEDSMYLLVKSSHALVLRGDRIDYGSEFGSTRYPADHFDRIWFTPNNEKKWQQVNTSHSIEQPRGEFRIPNEVLGTAVKTNKTFQELSFNIFTVEGEDTYIMLHFAEIEELKDNQLREFDIYANDSQVRARFSPSNFSLETLYVNSSGKGGMVNCSLKATGESNQPPLINAVEILALLPLSGLPTQESDVNAILKIKEIYKIKSWQGDPCVPVEFTWEGLNCSYNGSLNPRIVSLNLSHRELNGEIPPYIAHLTALVSLDLSFNNLIGGIPDELMQLTELRILNLAHNQLSGPVSCTLLNKSENVSLSLSVDDSINKSCEKKRSYKKIIVPIVASFSSVFLLFLVMILIWRIRRKQKQNQYALREIKPNIHPESTRFSYEEIVLMTKNFQKQIGRGGYGIVYYGQLKSGKEVAVKMISKLSSERPQGLKIEAEILTRIHHKNLVALLGYCSELDNFALVYEFIAHGDLARHLSDKGANDLSWRIRLKIALDVAEGLDYLHSVCNPPIIHRNVKAAKILLDKNFKAKLKDSGLSTLFDGDSSLPVSRSTAGTSGYLDPEFLHNLVLNEKSDVYSFGIVLMELITGQSAVINGTENVHILSWVERRMERGNITEIIDPRIQGGNFLSSISKAFDVALLCTRSAASLRPDMRDVFIELKESLYLLSLEDIHGNSESEEQRLFSTFSVDLRVDENLSAR